MKTNTLFKKILIALLIIIGLSVLVLIALKILARPAKLSPTIAPPKVFKEVPTPTPAISLQRTKPSAEAVLALQPQKADLRQGEILSVAIQVDTGGKPSAGIDAVINYDPDKLAVIEIEAGTLFETYFRQAEDEIKQKIYLSAAIFKITETPFAGQGVFGTIKFKALKPGKTTLSFEYTPQATADSNVTNEKGLDFLTQVINGEYQIK